LEMANALKRPIRSGGITTLKQRGSDRQSVVRPNKRAVLFGYGNYAKTNIIPSVKAQLDLQCIHEVDPLQIPQEKLDEYAWDTSPFLRDEEAYDACFIAGFHHTHAPIAVHALRQFAYAVVEKPLVTDWEQLNELSQVIQEVPHKLFACFQKRYSPMNEWALTDLGIRSSAESFSYHCIVFEVPLPKRHWYQWPNSKSRLVSNGCHWIDHFLYLNGYCPFSSYDVIIANEGTINCSVELDNGSFFTMVLTDQGSARIGVQDHIELRRNDVTVKMVNSSSYQSENSIKRIRKKRINKRISYHRMYKTITSKILNDEPADSNESILVGSRLMLNMEDRMYSRISENGVSQIGRAHETNSSKS